MCALRSVCLVLLVQTVTAYHYFQDRIPNGNVVPHPCHQVKLWRGVGHLRAGGGGLRNPFGMDFARHNKQWTRDLCMMDSDGDGRSNGEELGDPMCGWYPGTFPTYSTNLSHPGICEPWGSEMCRESNSEVDCRTEEFVCDAIQSPDVFNITLRFPPTKVPTTKYTYICFTFELDMLEPNVDYHLIATKPYIDNHNVLHHIQLNGCGPTAQPLAKPEVCNMAGSACQHYLAIWTLGMTGDCLHKDAGFKIGRNGIKWLTMQMHWTNPQGRDDYMDSSGLILYLTKKLRKHNAGYWQTGQIHLNIPPGRDRYKVDSVCSSGCTKKTVPGSAYIMTGMNHMHYLGYGGNVAHYRDGYKMKDLTPDEYYNFDDPHVHVFDPPHEIRPGDVLKTTCVYNSNTRKTTTMFGESALDEMCLGIFSFYPAENITHDSCYTWKDFEICHVEYGAIHGCPYYMIFNASDPVRKALLSKVLDKCNFYGGCRPECPAAIAEIRKEPCFNEKTGPYIMDLLRGLNPDKEMIKFLAAMQSCECPWPTTPTITWPTAAAMNVVPALTATAVMTILALSLS